MYLLVAGSPVGGAWSSIDARMVSERTPISKPSTAVISSSFFKPERDGGGTASSCASIAAGLSSDGGVVIAAYAHSKLGFKGYYSENDLVGVEGYEEVDPPLSFKMKERGGSTK